MLCRRGAVCDIRSDNREIPDESIRAEPRGDSGALGERSNERSDDCVTGIERRDRNWFGFSAK
jgi:hypothetical protein